MEFTGNIPAKGLARIQIRGNRISSVQVKGPTDVRYPYISPGLIDLQLNGFGGLDFSSRNLHPARFSTVLPQLWKAGVTTFCPTVITNTHESLLHSFRILEEARQMDSRFATSAPCYHLEGPYISSGPSHGAHNPGYTRSPDWEEFLELQSAAGGRIGIVTLAPELPKAIEFIRRARACGVVVALGHTDATSRQIHEGADAGATLSTHLGNGNPQSIDRHHNTMWPQLALDQLSASLICDGFHLPADLVRVVLRAKGIDRCILITDALYVAGLPPGRYSPAGSDALDLQPTGQVFLAGQRCMAGSSVSLARAVSVFMGFTGIPLEDVLRAATTNPARLLQRFEMCQEIAEGQLANLTLFRLHGIALEIETTVSEGEVVFSRTRVSGSA